jgi:hypothetical protein
LNKTNGCTWLSTDDKKTLTWQNGEIITSIKPRGGDGILCIAFSQERLTKEQHDLIDSVKCAMVNDNVRCTAWVGTKRALERTAYADQDGMCQGNFIIHVDVISDTGNKVSKHFKITVGNEWHTLNAEMQECDCIIG